jgi:hypothetical protein
MRERNATTMPLLPGWSRPLRSHTKPKEANKRPRAMKTVSILALSTLVSSTIAGSSYDPQAATASSSSLRGSASTPNRASAPEAIAAEEEGRGGHRELLLPDQTCYEIGIYGNAMTIPCDRHVLSNCYTYPQCADTQQNALTSAESSCQFATVWNNTATSDPFCPWQYMCCFYTNTNSTV